MIILFSFFVLKDMFFPNHSGKARWLWVGLDLFVIGGNCFALKCTWKNTTVRFRNPVNTGDFG